MTRDWAARWETDTRLVELARCRRGCPWWPWPSCPCRRCRRLHLVAVLSWSWSCPRLSWPGCRRCAPGDGAGPAGWRSGGRVCCPGRGVLPPVPARVPVMRSRWWRRPGLGGDPWPGLSPWSWVLCLVELAGCRRGCPWWPAPQSRIYAPPSPMPAGASVASLSARPFMASLIMTSTTSAVSAPIPALRSRLSGMARRS